MPRAAGDGKYYQTGIIATQDSVCPCCGEVHGHLEGLGTPVGPRTNYVSVTTVLGATLPKDGLVGWAVNISIEGMLDLAKQGYDLTTMPLDQAKALMQAEGHTSYTKRDEKGEIGTRIHDVMEQAGECLKHYLEEGDEYPEALRKALEVGGRIRDTLDGEERGYAIAVLDWIREREPIPILVEEPMACHHHEVAGTGDLVWTTTKPVFYQKITPVRKLVSWEIKMGIGANVITDLKTSKDFRESHFIQVAFYGDHMVQKDLGIQVDHKTVLRVNPDGTWEEKETTWTEGRFLALLNAYNHIKSKED